MRNKKLLVTGGAGYIGSHVVRQLGAAGEDVVTLDNLCTGFREAVTAGELIVGETGDAALLERIFAEHDIDTILHFAAHTIVPESVADPLKYYRNNTCSSRTLLEAAQKHGVRHFVFSSTAAVYGIPPGGKAAEDSPNVPINPYGTSKLMTEWMLRDLAIAGGPSYVALRYFNVAGADPRGRTGQSTANATHLIKIACEAALGKRDGLTVFGDDYDTPDGTGVRDYIHVADLAAAHRLAIEYLRAGGPSAAMNCGYGQGFSVLQVIDRVKAVSGVDFPVRHAGRRAGDSHEIVAASDLVRETLGWQPAYNDLDVIVGHALAWEKKLAMRNRS